MISKMDYRQVAMPGMGYHPAAMMMGAGGLPMALGPPPPQQLVPPPQLAPPPHHQHHRHHHQHPQQQQQQQHHHQQQNEYNPQDIFGQIEQLLLTHNLPKTLMTFRAEVTGAKSWICNICGKSFTRKGSLQRHLETIHTQERARESCSRCAAFFSRRDDLYAHLRRAHNAHDEVARLMSKHAITEGQDGGGGEDEEENDHEDEDDDDDDDDQSPSARQSKKHHKRQRHQRSHEEPHVTPQVSLPSRTHSLSSSSSSMSHVIGNGNVGIAGGVQQQQQQHSARQMVYQPAHPMFDMRSGPPPMYDESGHGSGGVGGPYMMASHSRQQQQSQQPQHMMAPPPLQGEEHKQDLDAFKAGHMVVHDNHYDVVLPNGQVICQEQQHHARIGGGPPFINGSGGGMGMRNGPPFMAPPSSSSASTRLAATASSSSQQLPLLSPYAAAAKASMARIPPPNKAAAPAPAPPAPRKQQDPCFKEGHSKACGHRLVKHEDHFDFVVNEGGMLTCQAGSTGQDNGNASNDTTSTEVHDRKQQRTLCETHSENCGHPRVRHDDHFDYLVENLLLYQDGDKVIQHGFLDDSGGSSGDEYELRFITDSPLSTSPPTSSVVISPR